MTLPKGQILSDRQLITVDGDDASEFLEGLVTCSVTNLKVAQAAFGALLSPQGKILFDFFAPGVQLPSPSGDPATVVDTWLTLWAARAGAGSGLLPLGSERAGGPASPLARYRVARARRRQLLALRSRSSVLRRARVARGRSRRRGPSVGRPGPTAAERSRRRTRSCGRRRDTSSCSAEK